MIFCLLLEKGLAVEIVAENIGIIVHAINLIVLVLIPMVIIHIKGHAFSLSKLFR